MIICSKCKKENEDNAMFCGECGTSLSENVMTNNPAEYGQMGGTNAMYSGDPINVVPEKKKGKKWAIIAVILAVVVAIASIAGSSISEQRKKQEIIDSINNSVLIDSAEQIFKSSMSSFSPKTYFDEKNMEYHFEASIDFASAADLKNVALRSAWQSVVTSNLSLANQISSIFDDYEGVDVVYSIYSKYKEKLLVIRNGTIEYNAVN